MLSKIEFFEISLIDPDTSAECERLQATLCHQLRSLGYDGVVTPVLGGTLGVCLRAELSGERKFLKTHLPGATARARLAKEIEILRRLYGHTLALDTFEVHASDGTTRLCLMMPELAPLMTPMQPDEAAAIARECYERLGDYRPGSSWDFDRYLKCAWRAIAFLSDQSLLGGESAKDLRGLIGQLEGSLAKEPRRLCHGDFGPKNIMTSGARPIVIDWEDAFCGFAGYDYLYWLTFMENRPFLREAAFGRTGLEPNAERGILALVVLLKSFLAVRSGAYSKHKLSVQSRIAEVLELPNGR